MPPLYKQKSKNRQQPALQCKDCGSYNTQRVHRSFFEKLISTLSSGKYAYQKFYCKACKSTTYKSIDEVEKVRPVTLQGKAM